MHEINDEVAWLIEVYPRFNFPAHPVDTMRGHVKQFVENEDKYLWKSIFTDTDSDSFEDSEDSEEMN